MLISDKIFDKIFTGKTSKDAYLKAAKWVATNITSRSNLSQHLTYKFTKKADNLYKNDIVLTVYVSTDEEQIKNRHCEICQEVSSAFYMKQNKNMCESCKMIPYRNRVIQQLKQIEIATKTEVDEW